MAWARRGQGERRGVRSRRWWIRRHCRSGAWRDSDVHHPVRRGENGDSMGPVSASAMKSFLIKLFPALIVLCFGLTLFIVSARIWLPGDMAAPAPVG